MRPRSSPRSRLPFNAVPGLEPEPELGEHETPSLATLELAWSVNSTSLPFLARVIADAGGFRPILADAYRIAHGDQSTTRSETRESASGPDV